MSSIPWIVPTFSTINKSNSAVNSQLSAHTHRLCSVRSIQWDYFNAILYKLNCSIYVLVNFVYFWPSAVPSTTIEPYYGVRCQSVKSINVNIWRWFSFCSTFLIWNMQKLPTSFQRCLIHLPTSWYQQQLLLISFLILRILYFLGKNLISRNNWAVRGIQGL